MQLGAGATWPIIDAISVPSPAARRGKTRRPRTPLRIAVCNTITFGPSLLSREHRDRSSVQSRIKEFGLATELHAEMATDVVGEAPCKALRLRVARNVFEKYQHRELAGACLLEFFLHPEPARLRFPVSSRAEDKKKDVAAVDGVEASVPGRA